MRYLGEPFSPRGILDATLSDRKDNRGLHLTSKPAGSADLLESSKKLWRAPRLHRSDKLYDERANTDTSMPPLVWIFGHIHAGYGAKVFAPWRNDECECEECARSILCINAACANPGPARTLVNLPTVINVFE